MSRRAATDLHMPLILAALLVVCLLGSACEQTTNLALSRGHADGGLDAQIEEEDASTDSGLSLGTSEAGTVALCSGSRPCACSNGLDDDGDKQIDGFDGECTGPYDDDEATFRVNDVNEGNPKCADCFYDDNPGSGDDGCRISSNCTFDGTPGNGGGQCKGTCSAEPMCIESCVPITPNGCDCFGCCEVTHAGSTVPVRLVSTCTVQKIADVKACPRCQLAKDCVNPCERCELCPGKTQLDLPADCGGENSCSTGSPCDGPSDCALLEYCSQGCCVPILL
jgi:hypothetical protein